MSNPAELNHGDVIWDRYTVLKKLGSGSFGTIYLVEYKVNQKRYAVKVESSISDYALVPYEANVTLIMHGIDKREKYMHSHVEGTATKEGFAKVYSFG